MEGYIATFTIYTLAMIGVIFVGLVVVKKSLSFNPQKGKNNFLKVETSLCLEPRKNLYVVKAGKEKFLIASSGENCQFMTKLEDNNHLDSGGMGLQRRENSEAIQEYFNYGRTI